MQPMTHSCARPESSCVICHVWRRSDWHELEEAGRQLLGRGRHRKDYNSGEIVFAQGAENDGVHCVSGGTVGIRRLDDNGNSVLLGTRLSGRHDRIPVVSHRQRAQDQRRGAGSQRGVPYRSRDALRPARRQPGAWFTFSQALDRRARARARDDVSPGDAVEPPQARASSARAGRSSTGSATRTGRNRSICRCRAGTSPRWSAPATRPSRGSSADSRPMAWRIFPAARSRSRAWKRSPPKSIA